MKCPMFKIKIILLHIFFSSTLVLSQMSSDNFALSKYVMDMAGGNAGSNSYAISQSVGQPSPPGQMGSVNYTLFNGFLAEPMPQQGILVWLPDTSGAPGETIDIPVMVEDLTGNGILSLTFSVQADTAILKPVMPIVGGTLLEQWGAVTSNIIGDTISVGSAGVEALSGSGTLVLLRYQVKSQALPDESTTLHFTNFIFNEGTPLTRTQDGNFSVSSNFTVSGYAKYYATDNPVPTADAQLDGFSEVSNSDGYFEITHVPAGTYALKLSKMDDYAPAISAFDASFVLRHVVGLISLTPYQMIAADVTGNGGVSAFDASYILQYVVHLIDEFPIGAWWKFIPESFTLTESNWATAPDSIVYDPLNSNMHDQNFYGVVYGDVSGNWTPGPGIFSPIVLKEKAQTSVVQWGEFSRKNQSSSFSLPLTINVDREISAIQMELSYGAENLKLDSLRVKFQDENLIYQYRDQSGKLDLAAAFLPGHNVRNLKLMFYFQPADNGNKLSGLVSIERLVFDEVLIVLNEADARKEIESLVPKTTKLYQNYPNPFNPETTISFELAKPGRVTVTIFDVLGNHVRTLIDEEKDAGSYSVMWDAKDEKRANVASGIYFYKMQAGNFVETKKLVLIR